MNERMEIALPISLDALLLLLLGLSHLWYNPVSSTLMVAIMMIYLLLDIVQRGHLKTQHPLLTKERLIFTAKLFLATLFIFMSVVLPTLRNIVDRHASQPYMYAHDGQIQTEEAIKFLLAGKNPYTETYLKTPMAELQKSPGEFGLRTPAPLFHNAYLPFLFLFSIPFYLISINTIGWYDQRFVYLLLFVGLMVLLPKLTRDRSKKLSLLIGFGLNLFFAFFLVEGRNDVFLLFWLVLTLLLLQRRRIALSSAALALACTSKHTGLLFLPFYLLYLLARDPPRKAIPPGLKAIWPFLLVCGLIIIPFLIWDGPSFIDDTLLYISGRSSSSFPIWGYNLGRILVALGFIESRDSYFPFWILQLIFALPTLIWLLKKQWQDNHLGHCLLGYAAFSLVFIFFSRFLHDNYFGYIVVIATIAYFSDLTRFSTRENDASEEPRSI